jgi:hypothetical protein
LIELVKSGRREHYVVQDLVNTGLVEALVFVFQLKTGGPKVLCAPVCFVTAKVLCAPLCFVTAKANSDFTTLIF